MGSLESRDSDEDDFFGGGCRRVFVVNMFLIGLRELDGAHWKTPILSSPYLFFLVYLLHKNFGPAELSWSIYERG